MPLEQIEKCKKHLLAVIKLFDEEHDKARKINNKNHDKPIQDNRFRIIERAKKDLIESTKTLISWKQQKNTSEKASKSTKCGIPCTSMPLQSKKPTSNCTLVNENHMALLEL